MNASATRSSELLDQLAVGVWVTDRQGRILDVNHGTTEMLGYTREELQCLSIAEVTHPEDVSARPPPEDFVPGRMLVARRRLRHKAGHYLLVEGRARVTEDGRVVTVVHDITALAAAEKARADSERELRAIFDLAGSGKALAEPTSQRLVRVNRKLCEITGFSEAELLTRTHQDILHEEDRAAHTDSVGRALRGEVENWSREERFRHKDGHIVFAVVTGGVLRDAAGEALFTVFTITDITQRKHAEEALARSERRLADTLESVREAREQLQLVMDTTPVMLARCDLGRRFVWVNRAYVERLKMTPEEVRGRPIADVLGAEAAATLEPHIVRVLAGESFQFDIEVPYRLLGQRSLRVVYAPTLGVDGKPDGWVAAITDQTHGRELELALRLSEERYRSLTAAITSIIWTADPSGAFVEPQPGWEAYTGQRYEEYAGSGWSNALHPDDRASLRHSWTEAVRTGSPIRTEGRLWHASSGAYRHFEVRAVPIRNAEGTVREWIGTVLDVDDRERALRELKEAGRRKDEFLAMLSHELRNPLAPILTAVELLRRLGGTDARLVQYRDIIARQVQHMKRLLDDLLDVARVSQGKIQLRPEPLELSGILQQAIEVSRPLISAKAHELVLSLPEQPLPLTGDGTRLVQVFANILNNAAKYTDPGGRITLTAAREGDTAVVRVADNGVGMTADLIEHAFELFTQASRSLDRAQGGLGIGLTMVRSLVEMHGGSVDGFSEGPGRGSEFTVRLPLALSEGATAQVAGVDVAEGPPLHVLVVDDNVDAAESLSTLLELLGHRVTLAHDGPAALQVALAHPPDVMLLDIGLPGMDGFEVATRLRANGLEHTMIIALTGYGRDEDVRTSVAAGVDHHLVKPVNVPTLEKLLAAARPRHATG